MSFKNKTFPSKKGLFNALKCVHFTLKTSSFSSKKSQFMRVIIFKLAFLIQKVWLFQSMKNSHVTPKNGWICIIHVMTCPIYSISYSLPTYFLSIFPVVRTIFLFMIYLWMCSWYFSLFSLSRLYIALCALGWFFRKRTRVYIDLLWMEWNFLSLWDLWM